MRFVHRGRSPHSYTESGLVRDVPRRAQGEDAFIATGRQRPFKKAAALIVQEIFACGNCSGIAIAWCRTSRRMMNQLQATALNDGLRCKKKLWRETGRQQLKSLPVRR